MAKCKWIIDDYLLHDDTYHEDLEQVLKNNSTEYVIEKHIPFSTMTEDRLPLSKGDCVHVYGSVQFVKEFTRHGWFIPGCYYDPTRFLCSRYMGQYPINWFLNENFIMVPYGIFKANKDFYYSLFNTDTLFIRPDSGFKSFTGLPIFKDEFDYEINTLDHLSSVSHDTMILVSTAKNISYEYRYFIVDGVVVAHSQYKKDESLNIDTADDPLCRALVEKVATYHNKIYIAFVCDVGLTRNGDAKIIEMNALSSSGFYYADIDAIVKAVNEAAEKEYDGDITL